MSGVPSNRQLRVHVLHAMPTGNLGTVAAQRSLFKLLIENNFDVSVSTPNPEVFKRIHPEAGNMKVYRSLTPLSDIAERFVSRYIQWGIVTILRLLIFTFMAPFLRLGFSYPSIKDAVERVRNCDILLDLNLELFRGVPISVSPRLIKQKPRVLLIHKVFWSIRILQYLWLLVLIKSIFKKKLAIGPASFGPFDDLPTLVKWLVKIVLNRFVDLIFVRESLTLRSY